VSQDGIGEGREALLRFIPHSRVRVFSRVAVATAGVSRGSNGPAPCAVNADGPLRASPRATRRPRPFRSSGTLELEDGGGFLEAKERFGHGLASPLDSRRRVIDEGLTVPWHRAINAEVCSLIQVTVKAAGGRGHGSGRYRIVDGGVRLAAQPPAAGPRAQGGSAEGGNERGEERDARPAYDALLQLANRLRVASRIWPGVLPDPAGDAAAHPAALVWKRTDPWVSCPIASWRSPCGSTMRRIAGSLARPTQSGACRAAYRRAPPQCSSGVTSLPRRQHLVPGRLQTTEDPSRSRRRRRLPTFATVQRSRPGQRGSGRLAPRGCAHARPRPAVVRAYPSMSSPATSRTSRCMEARSATS